MDDDSKCRSSGAPTEASRTPRRRASEIITDFVAHAHGDTISVGDLTALLGDRAFGMLLLVLTLPNIIPLPGLSTATGVPMIVLGAQLAMGMNAPRLPRRLALQRRAVRAAWCGHRPASARPRQPHSQPSQHVRHILGVSVVGVLAEQAGGLRQQ